MTVSHSRKCYDLTIVAKPVSLLVNRNFQRILKDYFFLHVGFSVNTRNNCHTVKLLAHLIDDKSNLLRSGHQYSLVWLQLAHTAAPKNEWIQFHKGDQSLDCELGRPLAGAPVALHWRGGIDHNTPRFRSLVSRPPKHGGWKTSSSHGIV